MRSTIILVAILGLASTHAVAIVGGVDDDGGLYPHTGMLSTVLGSCTTQFGASCQVTLIAPTVAVTEAECGARVAAVLADACNSAYVNFNFSLSPAGPFADVTGVFLPPSSSGVSQVQIAVVTLAQDVPSLNPAIRPVRLSPAGYLDGLRDQGALDGALFTIVGDGCGPFQGPLKDVDIFFNRRYATSGFDSLKQALLTLQSNQNQGFGGFCTLDEGGVVIHRAADGSDYGVAIHLEHSRTCQGGTVNYRLDTEEARGFLAGFVTLP